MQTDDGWVAVAAAGEEHLGTLVLRTDGPLDLPERRTLERGALVTALVLLFGRTEAEAESRVRGELLVDLVSGRDLDAARLRERARQQGADLDGGPGDRRGRARTPTSRSRGSPQPWPASCTGSVASTRGRSSCSRPRSRGALGEQLRDRGSTAPRSG